ncbi:hypothetical protein SAMN04488523_1254 [Sulfitobacter brevis]|uniref:Transposase, Mutator family n=1 Tax=Sulfitobacter brevis TaxID=74348 RepID=A0A1I2GIJ4_9RHOB|nr:hypothetical protein SAMN04488523_1254 [Sulfitobacter brevis]
MNRNNDRSSGSNTEARNPDGTFAPGNPGKPRGSRHRVTQAIEEVLEGQLEALTQAAIDKRLDRHVTDQRRCLGGVAPVRRHATAEGADWTVEKITADRRLYRYKRYVML